MEPKILRGSQHGGWSGVRGENEEESESVDDMDMIELRVLLGKDKLRCACLWCEDNRPLRHPDPA